MTLSTPEHTPQLRHEISDEKKRQYEEALAAIALDREGPNERQDIADEIRRRRQQNH